MRHPGTASVQRAYLALLAVAGIVAGLAVAFAAALAGASGAATAAAPRNLAEPRVGGTPMVGEVLRTTRGEWTGTPPITFRYRWYRCQGRGAPDASDCQRISNASENTYLVRQADAGFRIRSQVVATNAEGSAVATSNPTEVIQSARPVNVSEPTVSGTPLVGSRLTANRGEWVGQRPITYSFQWLRCNQAGDDCAEIAGATDTAYLVAEADLSRTLRVRVTARNDAGQRSAVSDPTAVVRAQQPPPPPPGQSVPVSSLRAAGDRLVVAQVRFFPSPVRSRTAPIIAQVRVTQQQGRPVSGALVFMRATPRVVTGQTRATGADGWVTLRLVPNRRFPQPRSGFNVQFFVKAYRSGDPPLGGIAGYRLVQVPLAGIVG
ncbi:MAG TPA: hypothetical protein VNJ46_06160 [Gaiellaceae bacterium]|nr:hypothetical protein [Gaiellaceae bacterium]